MKVLFDTNVVLDLLLDRAPFADSASQLFAWVESHDIEGYLGATTVTTVFYLAAKTVGAKQAREQIRRLMTLCGTAPVGHAVLRAALELDMSDFEDAVLAEAARHVGTDVLVTRNLRDFRKARDIRVVAPNELVEILRQRLP